MLAVYTQLNVINKKTKIPVKKWEKDMSSHIPKDGIEWLTTHEK